MTAIKDKFDFDYLRGAQEELKQLEAAAIDRARIYFESKGKTGFAQFKNDNGFSVRVVMATLLYDNYDDVIFHWTDVQGRGNTDTVTLSRELVLGPLTEEELEFREYKRLEEKFDKKK